MPAKKKTEAIEDLDLETAEDVEPLGDFTIGDKDLVISFTQKRIEMYEAANRPIMATFIQNGGAFSVSELKSLLAYGLRVVDGPFVNPRKGMEIAAHLLEANGYLPLFNRVSDALERDCGFLFVEPSQA